MMARCPSAARYSRSNHPSGSPCSKCFAASSRAADLWRSFIVRRGLTEGHSLAGPGTDQLSNDKDRSAGPVQCSVGLAGTPRGVDYQLVVMPDIREPTAFSREQVRVVVNAP